MILCHWFVYKKIEILRVIILGTTAQSEEAKIAKERLVCVNPNCLLART